MYHAGLDPDRSGGVLHPRIAPEMTPRPSTWRCARGRSDAACSPGQRRRRPPGRQRGVRQRCHRGVHGVGGDPSRRPPHVDLRQPRPADHATGRRSRSTTSSRRDTTTYDVTGDGSGHGGGDAAMLAASSTPCGSASRSASRRTARPAWPLTGSCSPPSGRGERHRRRAVRVQSRRSSGSSPPGIASR